MHFSLTAARSSGHSAYPKTAQISENSGPRQQLSLFICRKIRRASVPILRYACSFSRCGCRNSFRFFFLRKAVPTMLSLSKLDEVILRCKYFIRRFGRIVSLVVFSGGQSDHRIVRKQSAERLSSPTAAVGCDWHGAKLTRPQIKEKKSSSMSCFFGRSSRNRRRFAPSPGPRISPLSVYAKKFLC